MSSAIDTATLPVFLRAFSAYHFRVRFEARQAITFSGKWYFLPRYALGNALKNSSRFSHLYDELFKPQEPEGSGSSPSSRLVIRADKPTRRGFGAGEALDLYITIISGSPRLVEDFLTFLPEWQAYNFFHEYGLRYKSYQLLNAQSDRYENNLPLSKAKLDVEFFWRHAPQWSDTLGIRFLTPTTLKIDQIFTDRIPFSRLMNRVSRRLYDLYIQEPTASSAPSAPFIFEEKDDLLLSQISIPHKPTMKEKRQYDMSGILGQLYYQTSYDPIAALMLSIAHWVHIGNHTVIGNGQIVAEPGNPSLYQTWLNTLSHRPKKVDQEATVLKKQFKRYLKEQEEVFDFVVSEAGAFIGLNRNCLVVKKFGNIICKQPAHQIEQISIIAPGVSFSSHVANYCHKRNIRIIYYKATGEAYVSVSSVDSILPSHMKAQMSLSDDQIREFASDLVRNKIKNQAKLLKYYYKYFRKEEELCQYLQQAIEQLKAIEKLPISGNTAEKVRQNAMLLEARGAKIYWSAFGLLIQRTGHAFDGRVQQGASDIVNQMLNYGYAILQSYVMRTIDLWQLSPNIGILHSTQDNKPALCFDLMEQYRSFVVDRSVLAILSKREEVRREKSGLLDIHTRTRIISKIKERWCSPEYFRTGQKTLSEIMALQTKNVRDFCLKKENKVKFYTPKW